MTVLDFLYNYYGNYNSWKLNKKILYFVVFTGAMKQKKNPKWFEIPKQKICTYTTQLRGNNKRRCHTILNKKSLHWEKLKNV